LTGPAKATGYRRVAGARFGVGRGRLERLAAEAATRAQIALRSCRVHDRVIAHILPLGFFFNGFSIFVFDFFVAANASSEPRTGRTMAAPNAASMLAMRSFFTGDLRCSQYRRTIHHQCIPRQSGRLLRNGRISPVRTPAAPGPPRPSAVPGKEPFDKVYALSQDMVLIKTHASLRICFFVVGVSAGARGTSPLSVVRGRVVPLRPLPSREASETAVAKANGGPTAEQAPPGAARNWVGPLRALTIHTGGDAAHAGAGSEQAAAHEGKDASARAWAQPLRPLLQPESDAAGADALDAVHAQTARVINQLGQARHKLQRAASPELRLTPAIRALWRTEKRLGRPLRVAICGEINSGKSSLANLLAGIESLPTAILSNTRIPTLLCYAAEPEVWTVQPNGKRARLRGDRGLPCEHEIFRIEVGLPSRRLQSVEIVDLPGLVDPRSGLPEIDLLAHHVDAAIWCTMSTQAWKESERTAWSMLPPRLGNRGILVATHRDLLHNPRDHEKLLGRLDEEVGTSFTGIVLLSTAEALAVMGKDRTAGADWVASGAAALESALGSLLVRLREQRAAAALRMTSRVAQRALARINQQTQTEPGA